MNEIDISLDLYRNFGISEWHEKSLVLSISERVEVLECLKNSEESELVRLVKLPFPEFAQKYFAKIIAERYEKLAQLKDKRRISIGKEILSDPFFKDPSFGYKLYFLSDYVLRNFAIITKNPDLSQRELKEHAGFSENRQYASQLQEIKYTPYDQIPILDTSLRTQAKYVYLTQYIDTKKAEELGLGISIILKADGLPGFQLTDKLERLNSAIKHIICLFLGMYGHKNHNIKEIAAITGITESYINRVIKFLLPLFIRPMNEFEHKIGYKEENQVEGSLITYEDRDFANLDITVQSKYFYQRLPQEERTILSSLSNPERQAYMAYKYMFRDPQLFVKNLILSQSQADKYIKMVEQINGHSVKS